MSLLLNLKHLCSITLGGSKIRAIHLMKGEYKAAKLQGQTLLEFFCDSSKDTGMWRLTSN